ncbi:MAG: hypothetical protein WAO98_07885 [Alphaproteobacteria bacterium]
MTEAQSDLLHVVLEYTTERTEQFLRIYNREKEIKAGSWLYPQTNKTDKQIADDYAYLGNYRLNMCDAIVPAGVRIKGWAWPSSNDVFKYEIDPKLAEFTNDREFPKSAPHSPFTRPMRLLREYFTEVETHYVRLYDKNTFRMAGSWLIVPEQVVGKSPEQLQELFALPFTPQFICDATAEPHQRVLLNLLSSTPEGYDQHGYTDSEQFIIQIEGGLSFNNERSLEPNKPISKPSLLNLEP